jgi:hypothetical protein
MPFLVEVEDAAAEIARAIEARKDVHGFPLPMLMGIKTVAALPNLVYDRLAAKMR